MYFFSLREKNVLFNLKVLKNQCQRATFCFRDAQIGFFYHKDTKFLHKGHKGAALFRFTHGASPRCLNRGLQADLADGADWVYDFSIESLLPKSFN